MVSKEAGDLNPGGMAILWSIAFLEWCQQTFSAKDQIANILDFVSYLDSVTTTQLCFCSAKVAIAHIRLYSSKRLFYKNRW